MSLWLAIFSFLHSFIYLSHMRRVDSYKQVNLPIQVLGDIHSILSQILIMQHMRVRGDWGCLKRIPESIHLPACNFKMDDSVSTIVGLKPATGIQNSPGIAHLKWSEAIQQQTTANVLIAAEYTYNYILLADKK